MAGQAPASKGIERAGIATQEAAAGEPGPRRAVEIHEYGQLRAFPRQDGGSGTGHRPRMPGWRWT